ncbi:MAG: ribosome small subunit-dependent GTPase, partial [Calothrix sp. SM1_7_51]|nr:ribosome small subunit-dependent GTPase [Calothrix sp. SM1_7_51]
MTAEYFSTPEAQLSGTVVAVQANFYRVQLDYSHANSHTNSHPILYSLLPTPFLLCTRRTRLKKIGQQVMVGDRVIVEEPDWAGGRGA